MRKLLFLYGVLFVLTGKAQTYVPFPTSADSAVWNISSSDVSYCSVYEVFTNGDTVINNTAYTVLGKRGIYSQAFNENPCNNYYNFFQPKRYIVREDSLKKVFYIDLLGYETDTSEVLLYDFNMQVGDSLEGIYSAYNLGVIPVVTAIDSMLIGNSYRKRILFENELGEVSDCFYLIEGVGSTLGFNELKNCPHFETHAILKCFKLSGETVYPDFDNCDDLSYINSTSEDKLQNLNLYPNPSTGQFNLSFETAKQQDVKLVVTDVTGRTVWAENNEQVKGSFSRTINLTNAATGIYFLNIIIDGKATARKLVVN